MSRPGPKRFRMVSQDSGACSLANTTAVRERQLPGLFRLDGKQQTLDHQDRRLLGHPEDPDTNTRTGERTGHKRAQVRLRVQRDGPLECLEAPCDDHPREPAIMSSNSESASDDRRDLYRFSRCAEWPEVLDRIGSCADTIENTAKIRDWAVAHTDTSR